MRTKIVLLSSTALLSAGITMHHFRYCPLQHLKSALAHQKTSTPKAPKDARATANTQVLALNK